MKKKVYDVYFLDDLIASFDTKKEAEECIKRCLEFDKAENNPWGCKRNNYEIEVYERG